MFGGEALINLDAHKVDSQGKTLQEDDNSWDSKGNKNYLQCSRSLHLQSVLRTHIFFAVLGYLKLLSSVQKNEQCSLYLNVDWKC